MDAEILSRIQFAGTIAFHYIFPPMSIGLGLILVIMEGTYLRTKNPLYHRMSKFWVKVFGLIFAVGVATGIVMEFQFGTNWSVYSRYVGDIFGSALAAEGIFAFFLESGFLAVLLFGWDRVSPRWHFFSTVMVAGGAHLSAVWIIVANSWQQTPVGYHIVGEGIRARAEITDYWAVVFSPSSMDRLSHVLAAAWQTGAFFVLSVSAFYLLRKKHLEFARASFKIALGVALVASLLQLITGHSSAVVVAEYQPAKLAAFEGHYEASAPADMVLLGWINEEEERTVGIKLPGMLSWLLYYDTTKPVTGLKAFKPEDRPPVNIVFQAYHLMVAIGMGLIGLSFLGLFCLLRGTLFDNKLLLKLFILSVLGPHLCNQLGWIAAEVGRQPWIVYGLLRTSEAYSPTVTAGEILASIILFALVYLLLAAAFIYLLNKKIQHGPVDDEAPTEGVRA